MAPLLIDFQLLSFILADASICQAYAEFLNTVRCYKG